MIVIGLTGGIASGKSTVSAIISEFDIPVIDADIIAREIMEPPSEALDLIKIEYGENVIEQNGTLNRKKLSTLVFNNPKKLQKLNSITHPIIKRIIIEKINYYSKQNVHACVIDAALLIEANFLDLTDKVILTYVNETIQIQRLINRDNISYDNAKKIISSQMPFEDKKKHANFIIDNSFDIMTTRLQVNSVISDLLGLEV